MSKLSGKVAIMSADMTTIIETRDLGPRPIDVKSNVLQLIDTDPEYDPATQIRTGPVVTVFADHVTRVWTVTAKTAAQLEAEDAARKDEEVNKVDRVLAKALFEIAKASKAGNWTMFNSVTSEQTFYQWLRTLT